MRITLTVMTPVWPTNDVRWHPWQTFAPPPLHIWPLPLSQTTLVKQDDVGDGKTYPSSMSEKFIIQTFVPKLTLISRDFSQLRAQDPRENANVFPPLAFFSFVIFLPRVSWEDGKRNRSFWHIPRCTPPGILPSQPLSMYISISALDIQSFCLGDSAQIRAALILLFAYSNVTFLCYSNFQFVIFKYFKLNLIIGDFSEADIRFSYLPFTFEQIFPEKTFWMDSLINFPTKEIFRNSKYFPECLQMRISDEWPNIEMLGKYS